MRHDYELPAEWASMSPAERDRWFRQERARRQARRQRTAFADHQRQSKRRLTRRLAARATALLGSGLTHDSRSGPETDTDTDTDTDTEP